MVDIESDGPIPGDYSMTSLGAIVVDVKLNTKFKVNIKPISNNSISKRVNHANIIGAIDAKEAMIKFKDWLQEIKKNNSGKLIFISDNNGFDWMFVCWYFWHFIRENPLGYYSENLQALYRGLNKNLKVKLSDIRERELQHEALEDATDNAKIMLKFFENKLKK